MMSMGRKGKEQGERGALLRPSREDSGTGDIREEKGNEQLITGQLGGGGCLCRKSGFQPGQVSY